MKKVNSMRWFMLVAGILMIILGIWTIFTPVANLVSIAIFISVALLVSGISEIAAYFGEDQKKHSGWVLAGGILNLLFGVWLLFGRNMAVMASSLPFVFAVWVACAGMMRAVGSFSLKELGSKQWGWVLALGILEALLGFALMYFPVLSMVMITVLLASLFISHGINDITIFTAMTRVRNHLKGDGESL